MSELLPVTITSIILALLSHFFSKYDKLNNRYERKERLFYSIMAVAMVLFVGLRTGYNDTGTYQLIYEAIPKDVDLFEGIEWLKVGENPGFTVTNRLLVRLGFSTQSFLMFYAAITVVIYLWFIRKYSCNIWLSVFLLITMGVYTFTLAAIKQCVSVAFCLLATDRALRKKYISFVLWILVGTLYHPYALMYLIVPLLMFRPWSVWTYIALVVFALVGAFMESLIGTVVDITDLLGENYDAESFTGEGINPFRLAVISVPTLVSCVTQSVIARRDDKENNLFINLSALNAEIMFVGLFGTANYFGRLANYFLIFQTISLPWIFTHFKKESKSVITTVAVVCYFGYYVFTNAIHESFDQHFYSTTLWEYLQSLFQ